MFMYIDDIKEYLKDMIENEEDGFLVTENGDSIIIKPAPTLEDELGNILKDVKRAVLSCSEKNDLRKLLNRKADFFEIYLDIHKNLIIILVRSFDGQEDIHIWDVTEKQFLKIWRGMSSLD